MSKQGNENLDGEKFYSSVNPKSIRHGFDLQQNQLSIFDESQILSSGMQSDEGQPPNSPSKK